MRRSLVTVVVAALAGVPAYLFATASPFGVGTGSPLGRLERIEAWLTERGFTAEDLPAEEGVRRELGGASFHAFAEVGSSMRDEDRQVVFVGAGEGGVVRTIRVTFYSGKTDLGIPNSKCEEFAEALWGDIAGGAPGFEERHRGQGIHFTEGFGATMSSRLVSGDWYKQFLEVGKPRSIVDFVVFTTG